VRKTLDGEDPEIHHYLEMEKSPPSPWDGEIYRVVEESILECYPDAVVSPFMLSGLSDSRFFRARGVPCYGITPARSASPTSPASTARTSVSPSGTCEMAVLPP
jgi:acetylornithine deacetylase/succinyl-diaminopimelate desuccinylase-like protein